MQKTAVLALLSLAILGWVAFFFVRLGGGDEGGEFNSSDVMVGGVEEAPHLANDLHVWDLATFAVEEHNKRADAQLKFHRVVKARQQVVAGQVFYITLEAYDAESLKVYEAQVWEKVWENFKNLEDFKFVGEKVI